MEDEESSTCPYGNDGLEPHPCPFDVQVAEIGEKIPESEWCVCCDECQSRCLKDAIY